MRLSVLINNFNYAPYLKACIDSALAQDHADKEIVVVDDGSTDSSAGIIASYGAAIVPVLKENGGQASCFNAGFARSTGDVIFLLDADDAFLPGKLRTVHELLTREAADWCMDRVTTDAATVVPASPVAYRPLDMRKVLRRGRFPTIPAPTSGLAFRRELLGRILPMPEARGVVLSDNYLKFAAAYLGRGLVVDTPLTFQRIHSSNRYTNSATANPLRAQIMQATGVELARSYPDLRRLGASLYAGGLLEGGADWRMVSSGSRTGDALPFAPGEIARQYLKKRVARAVDIVLGRKLGRS